MNQRRIAWKVSHADPTIASVRYRCLIPIRHLGENFTSRFYARNDSIDFSEPLAAVVFVKSFTDWDYRLLKQARKKGVPVYIDLCDNIFDRPPKKIQSKDGEFKKMLDNFRLMASEATGVITTGKILADRIRAEIGSSTPIFIIPDGLEDSDDVTFSQVTCSRQRRTWMFDHGWKWIITAVVPRTLKSLLNTIRTPGKRVYRLVRAHVRSLFWPHRQALQTAPTNIVRAAAQDEKAKIPSNAKRLLWFGHTGIPGTFGLTDLLDIRDALGSLSKKYELVLVVISNNYQRYAELIEPNFPIPTLYKDWSIDSIERNIRECDVTLVPNPLNKFSLAKSPNRTLLSLAQGVPVVATKTPALETFDDCVYFNDWEGGISAYLDNPELRDNHVRQAKQLIHENYAGSAIGRHWARLFEGRLVSI
ncbi:MAG: glycosyltransferase family 1 protein [Bdellovibrionaceae bacterium]|nr:glycosyltransferase family 1 protein [Bdellovibrionales bacterium]MCB9254432.1 glycosyltransferase family 1 protein [Pseudobdellovibrionaceae bacterium]